MIKITKSYPAPVILSKSMVISEQAKITRMICAGIKPSSSDFNHDIFGHSDVKKQLKADQNNKCAYCECELCGDFGAVEHFRPKTGYNQLRGKVNYIEPGYHWLAYDWSNLMLSCDKCNATNNKGNMFPLQTPSTRDIQHQNITSEDPLFIDPTKEYPDDFIEFHGCEIKPKKINGIESKKGKTTIDEIHLNREELFLSREKRWLEFQELVRIFMKKNGCTKIEAVNSILPVFDKDSHVYAGMFRYQKMW